MGSNRLIDTIAAIATPPGKGGVGIIRISGPLAPAILKKIFHSSRPRSHFSSHKLYYGSVIASSGDILDEALAVHMHAPHTYTREDVVELQCHGSYAGLQNILQAVLQLGARPADPGEFTKRAFLAGRIDLTQAEAVLDLLEAQTAKGAQLAAHQLQGELRFLLEGIRQELIAILAQLEVAIDFPDDEVEIIDKAAMLHQLDRTVLTPLSQLLRMAEQGKIFREGIKVVLAGLPNVGKSSLLNALLQEERALVTPIPGTTRDTIEETITLRGIPIHLVDTAGIRPHLDPVEAMGIDRARQKFSQADVVFFLIDTVSGFREEDRDLYDTIKDRKHLIILNKCDIADQDRQLELSRSFGSQPVVMISAKDRSGLEQLQDTLYHLVVGDGQDLCERMACVPNVRHHAVLIKVLATLQRFQGALAAGAAIDLLAVELQSALDDLGEISGLTTTEDVLDAVFSKFCIGK